MSNNTKDNFDFQAYLQSDDLAELRHYQKITDIIYSVSGSISIISSSAIIFHILRSHKGLSSTYHRLVFGLCVGDLMVSFAFAFNSTAVPKDMQYLIPFAHGNMETCTAQGLFVMVGIVMASFYNCMICLYYLSIITYNKNDEYIKQKLEPWFHGVPIILAVVVGIAGLIMKQFNNDGIGGRCYLSSYHPSHCQGIANGIIPEGFTVPCGRGDTESGNLFKGIVFLLPLTITPAIIVGSMVIMYRTVRKIERKMLNYGAGALRLRAQQRQAQVVDDPNAAGGRGHHTRYSIFIATLKNKLVSICPCMFRNGYASRSNNARSQKRAVLYMAMGYSLTWALTWVPYFVVKIGLLTGNSFYNKVNRILPVILLPLQGLYNLIAYMAPKVRSARNTKKGKLPWRQAIAKAWMSRGKEDRAIVARRLTNTASLRQRLTASIRQHFQGRLSRLLPNRKSKRSPALTSTNACVAGGSGAIIHQPPSDVK